MIGRWAVAGINSTGGHLSSPGKRMASYQQFAKLERSLIGNCCTVGLTSKAHLEKDMNGVRNERGGC